MVVRTVLRSPAALAWTLGGILAVGTVAAGGAAVAALVRARADAAGLLFLGFGDLLYLVAVALLFGVAALVWLPFGAGVAATVGRAERGGSTSARGSLDAVLDALPALARWLKTRTAVPGLAEYTLTDDDVAPTEVVTGCEPYVVPALVVDTASLQGAVDRANRVTPRPGRERLWAGTLAVTLLAAAIGYGAGTVAVPGVTGGVLALAALVVGLVVTAALDAAWRAETYASQDLDEGFRH